MCLSHRTFSVQAVPLWSNKLTQPLFTQFHADFTPLIPENFPRVLTILCRNFRVRPASLSSLSVFFFLYYSFSAPSTDTVVGTPQHNASVDFDARSTESSTNRIRRRPYFESTTVGFPAFPAGWSLPSAVKASRKLKNEILSTRDPKLAMGYAENNAKPRVLRVIDRFLE